MTNLQQIADEWQRAGSHREPGSPLVVREHGQGQQSERNIE